MSVIKPVTVTLKNGASVVIESLGEEHAAVSLAQRREAALTSPYIVSTPADLGTDAKVQLQVIRELRASVAGCLVGAWIDGELVGMVGLRHDARRRLSTSGDIGMGMSAKVRGLGLGRALLSVVLDHAWKNTELTKVTLGVIPENLAAVKLYLSMGFLEEGLQRAMFRADDGRLLDHSLMAVWVKPGAAPPGFCEWKVGTSLQ